MTRTSQVCSATTWIGHPAIRKRHSDLIAQNTPSARIWADFYHRLEMVAALGIRGIDLETKHWVDTEDGSLEITIPARPTIFAQLVAIGVKHEADGIARAKTQMEDMVQSCRHYAADWAAGDQQADPKLTEALADEFEQRLKDRIDVAARAAYLEAAKYPPAEKIIDRKLTKASGTEARENQADPDAEKNFNWKLKNRPMVSKHEVMAHLGLSNSGIKYWVSKGILKRGTRNMLFSASVTHFIRLKLPRKKRSDPAS